MDATTTTNENSRLIKYRCSKCGKPPSSETDLFKGCSCGNRLFRIVRTETTSKNNDQSEDLTENNNNDMEFLTIKERDVGIYEINIDILLKKTNKKQINDNLRIAGAKEEGIYEIRI